MKKIGGILFLVGTVAGIIAASLYKASTPQMWMEIFSAAALVGALMTGSSGIWIWIVGTVMCYVGAKGFIGVAAVNTVLKYGGMIVNLIAMIIIWKDSIKDAFK